MRQEAVPILAIVVPCYNEAIGLQHSIDKLLLHVESMAQRAVVSANSFVCCVDDGSRDKTWEVISAAVANGMKVTGVRLSSNCGHQVALYAGLVDVAGRCDIALSIDADLQQDPGAIPRFVEAWRAGAEVVFGVRRDRASDSWLKRTTAAAYYKLMRIAGLDLLPNSADYRLVGAKALSALSEHPEQSPYLRALFRQIGFQTATVSFDVVKREFGTSKYTVRKMVKLAVSSVISYSTFPLKLITWVGASISVTAFLMAVYALVRTLIVGDTTPGWASTVLPIYMLGGVQLLFLGIIGEYVGQLVVEVKRRPRYIIEEKIG